MKFHITMLCGGQSMMLTPSDTYKIDLDSIKEKLPGVIKSSKDMLEFMYKGIKITLYTSGSVFFYHFIDKEKAFVYAEEILLIVNGS